MYEIIRKLIIHTNTQVLIIFFIIYNNLDSFKNRVEIMLGVLIKLGIDCDNFINFLLMLIMTLFLNFGGWKGYKIFGLIRYTFDFFNGCIRT